MIFATVQQLEKYDVMCEGNQAGLYGTYFGRSPVLFNLITRASLVPFQFEPFSVTKEPFFVIIGDELYEKTLTQTVGGKLVERLCCDLSPIQMLDFFLDHLEDVAKLGITEYWYGDVRLTLEVIRARALQWKKYQRREMARAGNMIQAQFGPVLSPSEEDFLLKMNPYHRDFRDPVKKEGRG